jgi:hypothetical protein
MRVFGLWNSMVLDLRLVNARACAADRRGYVDCPAVWMPAAVEQFKEYAQDSGGCSYIDRSIATLVNCQPQLTALIRNKTFSLLNHHRLSLVGSTRSALRLQPLKRISGRQWPSPVTLSVCGATSLHPAGELNVERNPRWKYE